jgi:hypothetical protein
MNLSSWLHLVESIAPLALAMTPLAPIAPWVTIGIQTAERIPGASGPQKLALAKTIVSAGVAATNAQAGEQEIDPTLIDSALSSGISAVVDAVNVVHAAQDEKIADAIKVVAAPLVTAIPPTIPVLTAVPPPLQPTATLPAKVVAK